MSEPLVVIDRSRIREGKREQLEEAIGRLADFVAEREPSSISYDVYFDTADDTMTVLQIHPSSESMEEHLRVAADAFAPFADLLRLESMEVFGTPSEMLLGLLRRKIDLLGDASISVHEHRAGFARFADPG